MFAYRQLLIDILRDGEDRADRTGVGTISVFGKTMRFDLSKGFPLLTLRKLHFKSIKAELLWFLSGETNIKYLKDNKVSIWDEWANEDGEIGPSYGYQWRSWPKLNIDGEFEGEYIDQIKEVIQSLKTNPTSRRHLVIAWNPGDLENVNLPWCHVLFQFYISNDKKLSCQFYQRTVDTVLGLPFNIASYALLTHMIAQICGYSVGELIWIGGDTHIYKNHIEGAKELVQRNIKVIPTLKLNPEITDIDHFTLEDIEIQEYFPHPRMDFDVAV